MNLLLLTLALAALDCGGNGAVARIRVGQRTMTGEVRLQFGLGAATEAQAVEVQWPGGALETIGALKGGQIVTITEGKGVTAVTRYTQ